MLVRRVLTGALLLLAVLGAIFTFSPLLFMLFIGAVVLAAAWEWSRLIGLGNGAARAGYLAAVVLLLPVSYALPPEGRLGVLIGGMLWWILVACLVLVYPRHAAWWGRPGPLAVAGLLMLLPSWVALLTLREMPLYGWMLALLMGIVVAADIGAYFCGRAFGRRKLAPRVSPNKTWEGFWGGVAACCILAGAAGWYYSLAREALGPLEWGTLLLCAALVGMVSVIGDLAESMVKRLRNVKDSGALLPGHGGVLDRIDSITAAAPVYALLVMSFGADRI